MLNGQATKVQSLFSQRILHNIRSAPKETISRIVLILVQSLQISVPGFLSISQRKTEHRFYPPGTVPPLFLFLSGLYQGFFLQISSIHLRRPDNVPVSQIGQKSYYHPQYSGCTFRNR
jgi:hypothetical protein